MISSELPEIMGMSDRILVMRGGTHRRRVRARRGQPGGDRRGDDERGGRARPRRGERLAGDGGDRAPQRARARPRERARAGVFGSQEMVLFLAILTLLVVVGTINPRYVAERNLHSIFLGNAYIAVAAIGMSMVIISGNIDISVGSLIGVLATLSGTLAVSGYPIVVSWLAPLVVGAWSRPSWAFSSPICASRRSW